MSKITVDVLNRCRKEADEAGLEGADLLRSLPDDVIMEVCNGIGPEWFPPVLRTAIDKLHPSLIVVSMIHDLMYYLGDGSEEKFREANRIFRSNGYKMAKYNYGWYNPIRYKVTWDSWKFGNICDDFGRLAYDEAIKDRIERSK